MELFFVGHIGWSKIRRILPLDGFLHDRRQRGASQKQVIASRGLHVRRLARIAGSGFGAIDFEGGRENYNVMRALQLAAPPATRTDRPYLRESTKVSRNPVKASTTKMLAAMSTIQHLPTRRCLRCNRVENPNHIPRMTICQADDYIVGFSDLVGSSAGADSDRSQRLQNMLAAAVRHELVTLPYYDVFDWLEAELLSGGSVVLRGEVVRPTTSDNAENRVRKIEGVAGVVNQIKVLSISPRDNDLRIALYRAIYDWNSPLFRYAMRAMPPIHIVVENSRVTLKGAIASQLESQLAYTAANQVLGVFEVRNELRIDK